MLMLPAHDLGSLSHHLEDSVLIHTAGHVVEEGVPGRVLPTEVDWQSSHAVTLMFMLSLLRKSRKQAINWMSWKRKLYTIQYISSN